MSNMLEERVRVSRTCGSIKFHPAQQRNSAEAAAPKSVESPSVEIVLSAEAKAALQTLTTARPKGEERAECAVQSATEVASATGISEADAVAAAQPLRSPPPAKAIVMFQASPGTSSTEADK